MIAIVLVGVMLDRPTLTMRTLTFAALVVLFFAHRKRWCIKLSDVVCGNALIATYARGVPFARAGADSSLGRRAALWGVREIVGLVIPLRWSPDLATVPMPPITFTGSRLMACSPTSWRCRSCPPG